MTTQLPHCRARLWWGLALFALFAALAVPITVSFDGLLYFQSSRYMFTDAAADGYQWTRGPLYPGILRVIRIVGGTGSIWIVAVQAAAAAAGAWIVTRAVLGQGWARWVALALVLLNPLTLGYAGSVLQQTWIMVVLSLNTGLIWAAISRRVSPGRLALALALLTLVSIYLVSQLAYVCALTGGIVGWSVARRDRARDAKPSSRSTLQSVAVAIGATALAGLAVLAFARVAMVPWNAYKESVLQGAEANSAGIPTSVPEPSPIDLITGAPERLPEIADTASVILDVPLPDAVSTWGGDENDFFGFQPFSPPRRCGVVQYNDVVKAASEATAALLSATCVSKGLQGAIDLLVRPGYRLHMLSSYAFVLGLVAVFWRRGRRTVLLLSPFYAYWAMYSVYGASLDRYGFPLYVASATMLVFLVVSAVDAARWMAGRRRPAESEPEPALAATASG